MSKLVLLVDSPKTCTVCPLSLETEVYSVNLCWAMEERRINMDSGNVPDWCPLRELPKKKKLSCDNWEYNIQVKAWNACIDAIGGDAK